VCRRKAAAESTWREEPSRRGARNSLNAPCRPKPSASAVMHHLPLDFRSGREECIEKLMLGGGVEGKSLNPGFQHSSSASLLITRPSSIICLD
jgi:hypothetical protein